MLNKQRTILDEKLLNFYSVNNYYLTTINSFTLPLFNTKKRTLCLVIQNKLDHNFYQHCNRTTQVLTSNKRPRPVFSIVHRVHTDDVLSLVNRIACFYFSFILHILRFQHTFMIANQPRRSQDTLIAHPRSL